MFVDSVSWITVYPFSSSSTTSKVSKFLLLFASLLIFNVYVLTFSESPFSGVTDTLTVKLDWDKVYLPSPVTTAFGSFLYTSTKKSVVVTGTFTVYVYTFSLNVGLNDPITVSPVLSFTNISVKNELSDFSLVTSNV